MQSPSDPGKPLLKLRLWVDLQPRPAPENMAFDEAMLLAAEEPWLRVYGWQQPSLSIGFSQPLTVVPTERSAWPVVRRWTGGGVVVHDGDWTYTLAVPASWPLSQEGAGLIYRMVHEALIAALDRAGLTGGELQPESTSNGMGVCFVEPARYDVVWRGRKIAGAAQRRAKGNLLHQGSVQGIELPTNFAALLAAELAHEVVCEESQAVELRLRESAAVLVANKYGWPEWLTDRKSAAS